MSNNPLQSNPPISMDDIIVEKEFSSGTTKNIEQLVTEDDGVSPHIVLNTFNPASLITRIQEVPRSLLAWLGYNHALTGSGGDGTETVSGTTGMIYNLNNSNTIAYGNFVELIDLYSDLKRIFSELKVNETESEPSADSTGYSSVVSYSQPSFSDIGGIIIMNDLFADLGGFISRGYIKIPLSSLTNFDINKAEIKINVLTKPSGAVRAVLIYFEDTSISRTTWNSYNNNQIISDVVSFSSIGNVTFTLNSLGVELVKTKAQSADKYLRVGVILFDYDYLNEPWLGNNLVSGTDSDFSGASNWQAIGYSTVEMNYDDGVGEPSMRITKPSSGTSEMGASLDYINVSAFSDADSDYVFNYSLVDYTVNTYCISFKARWAVSPAESLGYKAHLEVNSDHFHCGALSLLGFYGSWLTGYSSSWERRTAADKVDKTVSSGIRFLPYGPSATMGTVTTDLLISDFRVYEFFFNGSAYSFSFEVASDLLKCYNTYNIVPVLTTTDAYSIAKDSAYSGGNITNNGGSSVSSRGVCWNLVGTPTIFSSKTVDGSGDGSYSSFISSLSAGTNYYARAYAINSVGAGYGNQISFTTEEDTPVLTTRTAYAGSNGTTASSGGDISAGNGTILSKGVCWNEVGTPTILNDKTNDGTGTSGFNSSITGLDPGSTYYIRAYASNSTYTGYGNEETVTMWDYATITDGVFDTKGETSLQIKNVDIVSTGDSNSYVQELGLIIKIGSDPTISNYEFKYNLVNQSVATGYILTLSGITSGYTYKWRVYALNDVGYVYGSISEVTIGGVPTLYTTDPTNIDYDSADSGGYTISDNGPSISEKGCVCKSGSIPTISSYDVKTSDGTGEADFSSSITGLSESTSYYIRSYATNLLGTGYGDTKIFSTTGNTPSVTTSYPGTVHHEVTNIGASTVTSWGLCWNSSGSPTTSDSKDNYTGSESSPFSFYGTTRGLTAGDTYYLRAYAINGSGTGYGNEIEYTYYELGSVTTDTPIGTSETGADCGGNVTDDGGQDPVTDRGIVWNTSSNPTISSYLGKTSAGGGSEGTFDADMADLSDGETYYVRAYVTNDAGTSYGNQVEYTHAIA